MTAKARIDPATLGRLHEQSGAARWGVSLQRFESALIASAAHAFTGTPPAGAEIDRYVSALHLEDLALAVACADGAESAWEHFVAEYRPVLRRAAQALDPGGGSTDLADALFAELYGLKTDAKDGGRRSLLRYFHGRSRLGTWLRAVLAQRRLDQARASRRVEPLPDDDRSLPAPAERDKPDPERARFTAVMREALAATIAALAPRDRLRLSAYYAQDLTLAAIGRLLREHEATVSRHLTRTRREIRATVEAMLRDRHGMDDAAVKECFRSVAGDAGDLDIEDLLAADRKERADNRSKG